ncbi:M20 family metallopeptidase [Terrisporobacter mayombei]|uniref:N-acetylcysteine deacetylase n=1 Tax=Terrisporobacter mayombei TaxID=1541 RepID=A0ABY9PZP3_9FIRM|nr:M20 family metallopeptidase [Terrisporobacter mayombei]MCC3866923.1 amidohydrolase [Terrisporobacter mayombei]WMT81168.1 N-acetylcysteine deacetylase [Terrisporobacter mayombei]
MTINELAKVNKDYVISLRREFHKNPEVSFKEFNTSKIIKEELDKIGIEYISCASTGVVATIKGNHPGKTVALRADIDALSVQELNNMEYKSLVPGMMHACGHDGHASMLLGAAKILYYLKDEIHGTIKLFFQPAEEIGEGAKAMIKDGAMNNVDSVFGIHLWSNIDVGEISVESGPRMASADWFSIDITGKGGHGSAPHECVDALVVASSIVMNLQNIVSRQVDPLHPLVLSVGMLNSGSRFNVIAENAYMEGTTRCFNLDLRKKLPDMMENIIDNVANGYGAKASLNYNFLLSPTINDTNCSAIAEVAAEKIVGKDKVIKFEKVTGSEDFSFYLEKAPGTLAFVGCRNEEKSACYPHHSGNFNIDEDALEIGTKLYVNYAIDYLN